MNHFDSSIITFVNGFAHHSWVFDTFVNMLSDNNLLKGGVIVALIWWAWFRPNVDVAETRQYLLCGILACLLSVFVARALANSLPFVPRPMSVATLHFQAPYGQSNEDLINWSAFPSDHAAVFFALAASIFFAWRPAGILAFCHVIFFICLPRLYLGFHAPSDLLAGAAIGIVITWLICTRPIRAWMGRTVLPWLDRSPGLFYSGLFIMTFQIVTLFQSMRAISHFFYVVIKPH